MEHIEVARFVDAPADKVWSVVGDFGSDVLSKGYVRKVELKGQGIGAVRIYHLHDHLGGGAVAEELSACDEAHRSYSYRMTDNGPLPWTGYQGCITVTPCGPTRSAILFQIQMTPIGVRGEEVVAISLNNISQYMAALHKVVGAAS